MYLFTFIHRSIVITIVWHKKIINKHVLASYTLAWGAEQLDTRCEPPGLHRWGKRCNAQVAAAIQGAFKYHRKLENPALCVLYSSVQMVIENIYKIHLKSSAPWWLPHFETHCYRLYIC